MYRGSFRETTLIPGQSKSEKGTRILLLLTAVLSQPAVSKCAGVRWAAAAGDGGMPARASAAAEWKGSWGHPVTFQYPGAIEQEAQRKDGICI